VFTVVEFWAVGPEIAWHRGAINNAVESRVKIGWFGWVCQCLLQGVTDGANGAGDGGLGGVKHSG